MNKAKHIGILACSAEGAALCYRAICNAAQFDMGEHRHPEITLHNHCLGDYMEHIGESSDWQSVGRIMQSSYDRLCQSGAQVIVCPDNTIHQAFEFVQQRETVEFLHIADEVAKLAEDEGISKVGILGTRFLMEGPVYPDKLYPRNIEYVIPSEVERIEINRIIFEELVNGEFSDSSREYFSGLIDRFSDAECDAVVLGCTEIPLLVEQKDSSLYLLDSTRILAHAALQASIDDA